MVSAATKLPLGLQVIVLFQGSLEIAIYERHHRVASRIEFSDIWHGTALGMVGINFSHIVVAFIALVGTLVPGTDLAETVPLLRDGGTYVVPVLINDKISLNFTLDSGAADVSIPADVFSTLIRAGTITNEDLLDKQVYEMADGRRRVSQRFRIRSLRVGGHELRDVSGSVAPAEGSLLLGQSFLSRFKSWAIDNVRQVLVINNDSSSESEETTNQPSMSLPNRGSETFPSGSWPISDAELWAQGEHLRASGGYASMVHFFIGAINAGRLELIETQNAFPYTENSHSPFLPEVSAIAIERSEQWWLGSASRGRRLYIAILNRASSTINGLKFEISTSACGSPNTPRSFMLPLSRPLKTGELLVYRTEGQMQLPEDSTAVWHCLIVSAVW